MKKIIVFALMVMLGLSSVYAQRGGDPAQRLQREVDGLTTALALTPDQVTKVTAIVKDAQEKQSAAFAKMREAGGQMDREKMMADRKKSQEETDAKIKTILKGDQASKLDAYRKKQAEERAARQQ